LYNLKQEIEQKIIYENSGIASDAEKKAVVIIVALPFFSCK
jgi:hypothetical protein